METVVMFEEKHVKESSHSPEQIGSPVVYKLVRVAHDGRLFPATDHELMQVENLIGNANTEVCFLRDDRQTAGCTSNDDSCSTGPQIEGSEGELQCGTTRADVGKINARLEEVGPSSAPTFIDSQICQAASVGECSKFPGRAVETGLPVSASPIRSIPDFSKLEGKICLDNLSITELQEIFKATFGRETAIKDKQWLKRRIAMGLTNSCDVSTATFTIIENKLENNGKEYSRVQYHHAASGKRLKDSNVDCDCGRDDNPTEQRAAKRIRRPTRRYIEEISEGESKENSGRLLSSATFSGESLVGRISSESNSAVTCMDSLGASGIQLPGISRARRSRPRKNVMAFMDFHHGGLDIAAKWVKNALGVPSSQSEKENWSAVPESGFSSKPTNPVSELDKPCSTARSDIEQEVKHFNSPGDTSDDDLLAARTAKSGFRRKHHRAWTLCEVMKLVEGVAKYGAGRWSEIRRVAFTSYSYRTSVDLKDKWRNLLRASLAQSSCDKGMNNRKHGSMPIPAPILLRVRELAEMHSPTPPNIASSAKLGAGVGGDGQEARP